MLYQRNAFTLLEVILVISIISVISIGVGTFAYQGFRLWQITQDQVAAQESIRDAIHIMVAEIREMQISDNGSSALESVADNKIVFYANVDDDYKREQVTYELIDGALTRCIIESDSQEPPQYPACPVENRTTIAQNVINTDYIFRYYDDTYNGETAPLADPIDKSTVRLVQVRLLVDYDPGRTPAPLEVQTDVALRNLKDNL